MVQTEETFSPEAQLAGKEKRQEDSSLTWNSGLREGNFPGGRGLITLIDQEEEFSIEEEVEGTRQGRWKGMAFGAYLTSTISSSWNFYPINHELPNIPPCIKNCIFQFFFLNGFSRTLYLKILFYVNLILF